MHFPRSLVAYATLLSFSAGVNAAVTHHRAASGSVDSLTQKEGEHSGLVSGLLHKLFAKRQQPELIFENDAAYRILRDGAPEDTQEVCNKLIGPLDPATITVDYTPAALYFAPTPIKLDFKLTSDAVHDMTRAPPTSTTTSTTRTIVTTTETIFEDQPTLVPRAANAIALQVAQDVFTSILVADPTESSIASSIVSVASNTEREQVIRDMSTACSALNVAPTSTDTVTFTAPPAVCPAQ